tara:strand:- start:262 stop:432 length:171 start_codon:yes stop_codon:yes gene_type:complete
MKLTKKKLSSRKDKRNNPVTNLLKVPTGEKVANKKEYKRKVNNAGLLKMLNGHDFV